MVSNKKKSTVMSPIWRRMKKCNPSSGQNGQLVHWWLLIHSGRALVAAGSLQPCFQTLPEFEVSCHRRLEAEWKLPKIQEGFQRVPFSCMKNHLGFFFENWYLTYRRRFHIEGLPHLRSWRPIERGRLKIWKAPYREPSHA